ncbi:MAG: site-2 protease family protein [Candidatus Sumerlaeaceae bacterium]|nr:site-2 protease family protein [Candidatus Sumerlaeaceae bacterium]
MEQLLEILRATVAIVFTFAVAIFVHELGHFLFAKLFGVYVETFSIGFGRPLWKRKWGETTYQIALLPFGGYVKMAGMHSRELEKILEEDEKPKEGAEGDSGEATGGAGATAHEKQTLSESVVEEMDALRSKPYPARILVFAAGCINNLLTAVVVYFFLLWLGHPVAAAVRPLVERVEPSVASQVDLRPGDLVLAVEGKPVDSRGAFLEALLAETVRKGSDSVQVSLLRDATTVTVALPAQLDPETPAKGEAIKKVAGREVRHAQDAADKLEVWIGETTAVEVTLEKQGQQRTVAVDPLVASGRYWPLLALDFFMPPHVGTVLPNLPAERAGIRHGDVFVSVDGKPVKTVSEATAVIRASAGRTVPVELLRPIKGGEPTTVTVAVQIRRDPDTPGARGQMGIVWSMPLTDRQQYPFFEAWSRAVGRTITASVRYLDALGDLFTRSFQTVRENVGGPILIGVMVKNAADKGLVWFFELFAFFNIILAITNLLPLPVLDGGHIMFTTIEAIIRRPLPARFMVGVYNVFVFLLIGLALLITFNDVIMNAWRLL